MVANCKVPRLGVVAAWMIASTGAVMGCGGGEDKGPPPDPAGTITASVNYTTASNGFELYHGLADDGPYSGCQFCTTGPYPYVIITLAIPNASMNFGFHTGIAQSANTYANPFWVGLGSWGGEVADVGPVGGLGDVTVVPTVGWSSAGAVEAGHGYVVRFKRSKDYSTAAVPYVYARAYVVEYLIGSVSGGIIGAKIKYQVPF